jgi:hypothetical protein
MKTVLKVLTFGMMLMAFAVAPAFAQDECETIYAQFSANYKGPDIAKKKTAIEAGEQLIAKCSGREEYSAAKGPIEFVNKQLPNLRKAVGFGTAATAFDQAIADPKNVNADVAYKSGKELITADPNLTLDVALVLATIGFDKATAPTPVDTYNADALNYARQALQKIESGATSKDYGLLKYIYRTKEYPDGKTNAQAWMNYTIGYIMYNRQNQKKEALPYLYKATQYTSGVKKIAFPYQAIGDFYTTEYNRIDDERTKLAAEAKGKTDDAEKKAIIDRTKEMLLLQKGYADRIIDAYARAYAYAGTDQAYKTGLYSTLKTLYMFRFDGSNAGGLDKYISETAAKPMPDPMTAVTPVVDTTTTATTTTSTSSGAVTTTTPMTNTTTNSRPTTDTKATTNGATTNGKTTKTPVKPAPKKKGTR